MLTGLGVGAVFLTDLLSVLSRRWYLVVVGAAFTVGLALFAAKSVPVQYSAAANVLLLPPVSQVPSGGNPFLGLGGLEPAVDVTARALSSSAGTLALQKLGATGDFVVEPDTRSNGPLMLVTVQDTSAVGSLNTLELVVAAIPSTLDDLQRAAQVSDAALIRSTVVAQDATALPSSRPQLRAVLLAVAVGGMVSVLVVGRLDRALSPRREDVGLLPAENGRSSVPGPAIVEPKSHAR